MVGRIGNVGSELVRQKSSCDKIFDLMYRWFGMRKTFPNHGTSGTPTAPAPHIVQNQHTIVETPEDLDERMVASVRTVMP